MPTSGTPVPAGGRSQGSVKKKKQPNPIAAAAAAVAKVSQAVAAVSSASTGAAPAPAPGRAASTPTYKPLFKPEPAPEYGPSLKDSSTVSKKSIQEDQAKEEARQHKRLATADLIEALVKKDDKGKPVYKDKKVPAIKTSEEAVARDLDKFNQKVERLGPKPTERQAARLEVARTRMLKRNFKLDPKGEIKMKSVKVPVFKDKVSITKSEPGELDVHKTVSGQRAFQRGVKEIQDETREIRKTWEPGDHDYQSPKQAHLARAANAAERAQEEAEGGSAGVTMSGAGPAALAPSVEKALEAAGEIPRVTGVNYAIDYLTRPGVAAETAIAKGLVEAGLIEGKNERRIEKAPGPWEAFKRGHSDPTVVSGGDITEGLFGVREAGIFADIVTDPLMYTGLGGLTKAKQAQAALTKLERIRAVKPEALSGAKAKRLALMAERSGDFKQLDEYLSKVEAHNLTRGQRLNPRLRRRSRKNARARGNEAMLNDARKILAKAPTVGGQKVALPGHMVADAVSNVARHGATKRSLEPGFRIRALTPLGNEVGSIPVKLPKNLANLRVLPTGLGRKARASNAVAREGGTIAANIGDLAKARADIEGRLAAAMKDGDKSLAQELRASIKTLDDKEAGLLQMAKETETKRLWAGLESPAELAARKTRERMTRETFRVSSHFARQFEQEMQGAVSRALGTLKDDPDGLAAVSLYRMSKQDTGSGVWFTKNVRQLSAVEQAAVRDLEKLDRAIGKHGLSLGTLNTMVENYATRIYHESGDPFGTISSNKLEDSFPALGRGSGTQPYFGRHRRQPEMGSIANPQMLAKALRRISKGRMTDKQAREAADQLHRLGRIRGTTERLARALQRGEKLHYDDLTDLEKQSVHWSQHLAKREEAAPIFKDLDVEEGNLRLAEGAEKEHGFNLDPFAGLSSEETLLARIRSAVLDRDQLDEAIQNARGKTREQYEISKQRVEREIEGLAAAKPAPTPALKWNKVKAGRYATEDKSRAILKGKSGWNLVDVKSKKVLSTHPTLASAKQAADDAVRGPQPLEEIEGVAAPSHYGSGNDDPFDYTGRLNDVRAGQQPGDTAPNLFPVLDPRVSMFWRTRIEGVQSALRARWKGLDEVVGRSMNEAKDKIYYDHRGRKHFVHEIKPVYGRDGSLKGYQHRSTGQKFKPDQINLPENTLVPNRDQSIWYNPTTGEEFARPAMLDDTMGRFVQDLVGDDRLWPTAMFRDAQMEMLRMGESAYKGIYETGLEHGYGRFMGMIRYGVTAPFPAFHIRNMISDMLKSMQADSGVMFHPVANAKLLSLAARRGRHGTVRTPFSGRSIPFTQGQKKFWGLEFRFRKDGPRVTVPGFPKDLKTEEFMFILDLFGVRSTQHLAEFLRIANTGRTVGKWRRRLSPGPEGKAGQGLIELGARREDIMRFMTFTQRMRRNGGDVADAAWYMTKHHFDYSDLNAFERRVMRNIALFYTWYRKNIPLQFAEVIARPGFFSAVANSYYALSKGETPLNQDWSQLHPMLPDMSGAVPIKGVVPDYMLAQLGAATTSWNDHTAAFAFGAPWVDMNLVSNFLVDPQATLRQWSSLLNPIYSIGVQMVYGNEPLTGRDYKKYEPTSNLIGEIADFVGIDLKEDPTTGQPLLPWALNVAVRNIPIWGRASSYFTTSKSFADTGFIGSNKSLISGALGINTFMSPDRERLEPFWAKMIATRVGERQKLSFAVSNLSEKDKQQELNKFDAETIEWAKQHKIPLKQLELAQASGFYKSKEDSGGPADLPGTTLPGTDFDGGFSPDKTKGKEGTIPGTDFDDGGDYEFSLKTGVKAAESLGQALGGKELGNTLARVTANAMGDSAPDKDGGNASQVKRVVNQMVSVARSGGSTAPDAETLARLSIKYGNREGVPPSVLFAQQGIESGWGADITGPPTPYGPAQGWTQFIQSTRDMVLEEHGVDAYDGIEGAVEAQAVHLGRDLNFKADPFQAIFGYNHSEEYVNQVLGNAKAYTALDKVKGPVGKVAGESVKKLPGRADGSLRLVRKLVGAKVTGDAGFLGEPAGQHSAGGDHYAESSYAQDINNPAGNPAEGEPPYNDETLNTILKNLKKEGFPDVPESGSINETLSYEGTNPAGYRVQLYTNDNGAMNHIHVGSRYVGPGATEGYSTGTGSTGGYSLTGSGGAGAPVPGGGSVGGGASQIGGTPFGENVKEYLRTASQEREQRLATEEPYGIMEFPEYNMPAAEASGGEGIVEDLIRVLARHGVRA